jgi:hypothetical protein
MASLDAMAHLSVRGSVAPRSTSKRPLREAAGCASRLAGHVACLLQLPVVQQV